MSTLEMLAEKFHQLYLPPKEGTSQSPLYRSIVRKGMVYKGDLSHFIGSAEDAFFTEHTPVGAVCVVFLKHRKDFETFYQIMAHRCEPVPVPATTGAAFISGFSDWSRIRSHLAAYTAAGGTDNQEEFRRFTSDPANYRGNLLLLSEGPYSALPADRTPYSETEWQVVSRSIRKYHELTHFVCRSSFPGEKYPVWDELLADCMGLLFATGDYDLSLAGAFLGIRDGRYVGGRLENYLACPVDDSILRQTVSAMVALKKECDVFRAGNESLFDLMFHLQKNADKLCLPLF